MPSHFEQVVAILNQPNALTRNEVEQMADRILCIFGENRPTIETAELCKTHHPNSKVAAIKEYRSRVLNASLREALDAINGVW